MQRRSFEQTVRQILQEDSRYDAEAYVFMREALDFTVRALNKPVTGPTRHVTGREGGGPHHRVGGSGKASYAQAVGPVRQIGAGEVAP